MEKHNVGNIQNINMRTVHNKLLEIAIYLDEFCKEHDITYYLLGGSALGAIRHEGFIPWDDDLDVFMTYDNYMKFIEKAREHLDKERFYLQEEDTEEWPMFFTKLRMNNTTYIEEDTKNRKMHQGFFVDILCLNNVSDNKVMAYIQYICSRIISAYTLGKRGYITNSIIKKIVIFMTKIIVRDRLKSVLINIIRSFNNKQTEYVGCLFGRGKFKNVIFPSNYLGKPRYVNFESIKLPVLSNAEGYLQVLFGENYMDIPDQKTRDKYPIHAIYVDVENSYEKYLNIEI